MIMSSDRSLEIGKEYELANGETGFYIGTSDSSGMLPWFYKNPVINENSYELFARPGEEGIFKIRGVIRKDLEFDSEGRITSRSGSYSKLELTEGEKGVVGAKLLNRKIREIIGSKV